MWTCPQCGAENDVATRFCGHCGAARYVAQDGTVATEMPPAYAAVDAEGHPPPRYGVAAGVLLSVLILLALGTVGYLAWQRGLVKLPQGIQAYLSQAQPQPAPPAATGPPVAGTPLETGVKPIAEILSEMADMPRGEYRKISSAADRLEGVEKQLKRIASELPPQEADEASRTSQLERLSDELPKLLNSYKDFEEAAGRANQAVYGDQLEQLRTVFAENMGAWIDLLGRVYVSDPNPARPEYALEDQVSQAVAVYGRIAPDEIHQHWLDAVHGREQHALDLKYPAEYKRLEVWRATLHELRRKFNATAKELPPAEMNFGRLTAGGRGLLELYDAFAGKLEQLWPEWKKFAAALPTKGERPEKMDKDVHELELLFQSEHLNCFTEMYKLYALDAELSHPAYQHLLEHFHFVERNWPSAVLAYRGVYQRYEQEWETNWKDGPPANPAGGEDDNSGGDDLMGPPGFLPDLPPGGSG